MNRALALAAASALVVASGGLFATGAAAVGSSEPAGTAQGTLLAQRADRYEGRWDLDGDALTEAFLEDGQLLSTGRETLRHGLGAADVLSFGTVGGYGDPETGEDYAQLVGQAGPEVTEVLVHSTTGITTRAELVDGVWAAVWRTVDEDQDYGAAVLTVRTARGTTRVSTDDVDVVAADQRAADAR
ncbi:hypothetical protein [Rathayibacter sp. VKM Ac-2801]|uniref:hypothetical protein n=1 Tax=Rathayibacter sp. VKM Ac-2801 TaxID=2609255 RepID=UPI00131FEA7C|nr:hypothetical protein [Rathayibacter sp. VKM Ac-2801]QHC71479.1 hypothetical protein GSU45_14525 [Rathayibacter sp. VKM Ac-2801]